MKTNCEIEYRLVDTTAYKENSKMSADIQSFSRIEELDQNQDELNILNYATLEKNYFRLDGSQKLLEPNDVGTGYCSKSLAGSDGKFKNPVVLEINLENYHTSAGITITFGGDSFPDNFNVAYYRDTELIASGNYGEDTNLIEGRAFYCRCPAVEDYNKIVVTFYEMDLPYRFVKINHILFGFRKIFTPDEIMTASTHHEVNILSSELAINTLDFTVSDEDKRFNCINPEGVYAALQEKQQLLVYEYFDNDKRLVGKFFLESWSSPGESKSKFKAEDAIGLLDKLTFYGGVYSNIKASEIIAQIFDGTEIDYELQEDLKDSVISGYLPKSTKREALQQALFVMGAVADTSTTEVLKIYTVNQKMVKTAIKKDRKWNNQSNYEQTDIVTGVDITCYSYAPGTEEEELFKEVLYPGINIIEFSEPVVKNSLKISGATIVENNENYVSVNVETEQEVVVSGIKYIENKSIKPYREELSYSKAENILSVENATLINRSNADAIADRILYYYKKHYKSKIKFKIDTEKVGDCISVDTLYNNRIVGNIESMDIDLSGGAIATATVIGCLLDTYVEFRYCGDFSSGENALYNNEG